VTALVYYHPTCGRVVLSYICVTELGFTFDVPVVRWAQCAGGEA